MTWSRWRRSRESFRTTRSMRLKPNPFVSATLYHESQGERAGYGYFGKDIYGKFHKSPVLFTTEAEAREAMKKRMLRRNPSSQEKKGRDAKKIQSAYFQAKHQFEEAVKEKFRPRGASNFRRIMERFTLQPSRAADRAMPYAEAQLGPKAFALYKRAYKAARLLFHAFDREKYHEHRTRFFRKNPTKRTHEKKYADYQKILRLANKANDEFTAALRKQFPRLKHLGDVRYESKRHNAETHRAALKFQKVSLAAHHALLRARAGNV